MKILNTTKSMKFNVPSIVIAVIALMGWTITARADCTVSTLNVWWNGTGISTDNLDPCIDAKVIVQGADSNHYYIGGQFGHCMGLKTDLSPNQNPIVALSVCLAYVDPTTHAVTCYALTQYDGNEPGVTGYSQTVNDIVYVQSSGDVYVGGDFQRAGNNPYTQYIGCYQASNGWEDSYFYLDNVVSSLSYDTSSQEVTVYGSFGEATGRTYLCDPNVNNLTNLGGTVYYQTDNGAYACGYWKAQP